MTAFADAREAMVSQQIVARGIADPALLAAFRAVPREAFVDPAQASAAYDDRPLPIAAGQTISQPYIVALMIAAAGVGPGDIVLEVGAGSGYAAAILGQLVRQVVAIERHGELARAAAERTAALGYTNIRIVAGDGTLGFAEAAPYDAILAAACAHDIPQPLIDQLKPNGRLIIPVGGQYWTQTLVRLVRHGDGRVERSHLASVRFVPLIAGPGSA